MDEPVQVLAPIPLEDVTFRHGNVGRPGMLEKAYSDERVALSEYLEGQSRKLVNLNA